MYSEEQLDEIIYRDVTQTAASDGLTRKPANKRQREKERPLWTNRYGKPSVPQFAFN